MRKLFSLLLVFVMLFSLAVPTFAAEKPIKVRICNYTNPNGKWTSEQYVNFDVKPQIINGRTMVPIRAIAEELGYDVIWFGDSNTVRIKGDCCLKIVEKGVCNLYTNYNQQKKLMNLWYNIEANSNYMGKFSKMTKNEWSFIDTKRTTNWSLGDFFNRANHFRTIIDFKINDKKADLQLYDSNAKTGGNIETEGFYSFECNSTYKLDSPAVIVNGRTLVPLRAAAEMLGLEVSWDDSNKKYNLVTISA